MRIFVPFTRLRVETFFALPYATLEPILDKEFGYGRYFRERWREGKAFINVEHDVIPSPEILESMFDCPEELCVTGYVYPDNPGGKPEVSYLGCVKISAAFIDKHPNLFDKELRFNECDTQIWTASGNTHHYHGEVIHLHNAP